MLRKIFICINLLVLITFSNALADSTFHNQHMAAPTDNSTGGVSKSSRLKVPDMELLNQDGEKNMFVSDFIGDKLAAVTFTYTTCTTACPILDGIFQQVQDRLGERLGKEVIMLTLSIDPVTDIPPRLKAHAQKVKAKPGWSFLTGDKKSVNSILKALEVYSTDIFNHPPTVYIVEGRQGLWTRVNGYPSTSKVMKELDRFHDARAQK